MTPFFMKVLIMKKIFSALAVPAFVFISLFASCSGGAGLSTYKFDFPVIDISDADADVSSVKTESRRLPSEPVQGKVKLYVEELLLGPESERLQPLFSLDSSVDFCFVRNESGKDVLYLGLSESSVYNLPPNADIQNRIAILRENIRKNFKNIEKIVLFIGDNFVNE